MSIEQKATSIENKRLTREKKFIKKAKKLHGNKYEYNKVKYINSKINVDIYCKKHKKYFPQTPTNHLRGRGCKKCGNEKTADAQKMTLEKFIKKSKEQHGNKYGYDEVKYKGSRIKVNIYCKKCKKYFPQTPENHLAGQGCPKCGIEKATNSRKMTLEEFIKRAEEKHPNLYSYNKVEYVNSQTNVDIYCKKHKEYFSQRPSHHLVGHGCKKCGIEKTADAQKMTLEEFIKRAVEIHQNDYTYKKTKYINYNTKVEIYCKKCKKHFSQTPGNHLTGHSCPKCANKRRAIALRLILEEFIKRCVEIHQNDYRYDKVEYVNNNTDISIYCKKCKKYFPQLPNNHLNGQGCMKCAIKKRANIRRLTLEEFIKKAEKIHPNLYNYDKVEYVNSHTNVKIYCKKCKKYFPQLPNSHLRGYACPICSSSKSEKLMGNILEELLNKSFIKINPKWLEKLQLDRYCEELKLAGEYNGKQHYEFIPHFHRNGIKDLEKQQERDKRKVELCKKEEITLIIVPHIYDYTTPNLMKQYIKEQLTLTGFLTQEIEEE